MSNFQIYEAIDGLRRVKKNLKFASDDAIFSGADHRAEAIKACHEHRRYLYSQFRTAIQLYQQEEAQRAQTKT